MKTELSQKLESKMLEMLIVKSYPAAVITLALPVPASSVCKPPWEKVCCLGRKAHVTLCFQRKNRSPESSYGSPSV